MTYTRTVRKITDRNKRLTRKRSDWINRSDINRSFSLFFRSLERSNVCVQTNMKCEQECQFSLSFFPLSSAMPLCRHVSPRIDFHKTTRVSILIIFSFVINAEKLHCQTIDRQTDHKRSRQTIEELLLSIRSHLSHKKCLSRSFIQDEYQTVR